MTTGAKKSRACLERHTVRQTGGFVADLLSGPCPADVVRVDLTRVRMVSPAHRMAVCGVRVPLKAPAAEHVTLVLPPPENERAAKRREERDVGEWPAYEVVSALRRPVDDIVEISDKKNPAHRSKVQQALLSLHRSQTSFEPQFELRNRNG